MHNWPHSIIMITILFYYTLKMKTGGVFMFKILFAGLLFLIFTQNIYAFTKVNVKYKEVSETAYEEGEQIFTRPYFLEKEINGRL